MIVNSPVPSLKKTKSERFREYRLVTGYFAIGVPSIIKQTGLQSWFRRELAAKRFERSLSVVSLLPGILQGACLENSSLAQMTVEGFRMTPPLKSFWQSDESEILSGIDFNYKGTLYDNFCK